MKKRTMDLILIIIGISIFIFTGIMIWIYLLTDGIPDTLCSCFFAACTGEAGIMGWIKTAKVKNIEHQWELEEKQQQINDMKKALVTQELKELDQNEY